MAVGEWDERQLCPDGACVGVIGPDGLCKTCGHAAPNWGDERNRGLIDPPDDGDDGDDADDGDDELAADDSDVDQADSDEDYLGDDEDEGEGDDAASASGHAGHAGHAGPVALPAPAGWAARRLCADGSCIGVIGPDGRCKVCGRTEAEVSAGDARAAVAQAAAAVDRRCAEPGCSGVAGAGGACSVCGKVVA